MKVNIEFEVNEDTVRELRYIFERIEASTYYHVTDMMGREKVLHGEGEAPIKNQNGNSIGTIRVTR